MAVAGSSASQFSTLHHLAREAHNAEVKSLQQEIQRLRLRLERAGAVSQDDGDAADAASCGNGSGPLTGGLLPNNNNPESASQRVQFETGAVAAPSALAPCHGSGRDRAGSFRKLGSKMGFTDSISQRSTFSFYSQDVLEEILDDVHKQKSMKSMLGRRATRMLDDSASAGNNVMCVPATNGGGSQLQLPVDARVAADPGNAGPIQGGISAMSLSPRSPRVLAQGAMQALGRSTVYFRKNNRASLSFYKSGSERQADIDEAAERLSPCPLVHKLVTHHWFDTFFAFLILINAFVIAAESQYKGWGVGNTLGYPNTFEPESYTDTLFRRAGFAFGCMFALEIVLKIVGKGAFFFTDVWNMFDLMIVVFWVLEESLSHVQGLPDASLLRILRLMKLFRLVRLVRTIQGFDALYLMTTALWGSATILAWSSALIFLVLMMLALIFNQILVETYLQEETNPIDERLEVYEYFGTFSRSLLSLFEMTLANWPPVCRLLVENVSEIYLIPALIHKLTIGYAVIGVINGVFIQETFKVASTDDRIMVRQKSMATATHEKKMRALFDRADYSQDGFLDREEFRQIVSDESISTWLASMDLVASDVELLFELIDNGDGLITVEELIDGVSKLKGNARAIDLKHLMREQHHLQERLDEVCTALRELQRPTSTSHSNSQSSSTVTAAHRSMTPALSPRHTVSGASFANGGGRSPSSAVTHDSSLAKRISQAQEVVRFAAAPAKGRSRPRSLVATFDPAVDPKTLEAMDVVHPDALWPMPMGDAAILPEEATMLNV